MKGRCRAVRAERTKRLPCTNRRCATGSVQHPSASEVVEVVPFRAGDSTPRGDQSALKLPQPPPHARQFRPPWPPHPTPPSLPPPTSVHSHSSCRALTSLAAGDTSVSSQSLR